SPSLPRRPPPPPPPPAGSRESPASPRLRDLHGGPPSPLPRALAPLAPDAAESGLGAAACRRGDALGPAGAGAAPSGKALRDGVLQPVAPHADVVRGRVLRPRRPCGRPAGGRRPVEAR